MGPCNTWAYYFCVVSFTQSMVESMWENSIIAKDQSGNQQSSWRHRTVPIPDQNSNVLVWDKNILIHTELEIKVFNSDTFPGRRKLAHMVFIEKWYQINMNNFTEKVRDPVNVKTSSDRFGHKTAFPLQTCHVGRVHRDHILNWFGQLTSICGVKLCLPVKKYNYRTNVSSAWGY